MFWFFLIRPEGRKQLRPPLYFNDLDGEVRDSNHVAIYRGSKEGIMALWSIYDSIKRYQPATYLTV